VRLSILKLINMIESEGNEYLIAKMAVAESVYGGREGFR
jgi:hypothetical protein